MNILGIGGHAKVIIDILNLIKCPVNFIYDDDVSKSGILYNGIKVITPIEESLTGNSVISIGNNFVRKRISEKLVKCNWYTLIHPSAIISKDVIIGEGSVIMAGAIIQSGSIIGKHVIVNTGACVDHDCFLNDYVHVAPNVSIAGAVNIGIGAFIGIGSSIIQNICVGNWSTVGAGSVVINNIPENSKVVGNPARIIK